MSSHNQVWNMASAAPFVTEPDIACAGVDPEVFYPTESGSKSHAEAMKAKRICWTCPHAEACLRWALETGQDFGIWGATTAAERRALVKRNAA